MLCRLRTTQPADVCHTTSTNDQETRSTRHYQSTITSEVSRSTTSTVFFSILTICRRTQFGPQKLVLLIPNAFLLGQMQQQKLENWLILVHLRNMLKWMFWVCYRGLSCTVKHVLSITYAVISISKSSTGLHTTASKLAAHQTTTTACWLWWSAQATCVSCLHQTVDTHTSV